MPLEIRELMWYHPKATSAVQLPSNPEAHRNSIRVFSLHLDVNLGLEHYTKSAIYFATQMQGKLCESSQFFSASRFFWDWQITTNTRKGL